MVQSRQLNTPMYHLKTPLHRVAMVMHALNEGLDISAASCIFGHHHSMIFRWLERGGQHSTLLHEQLQYAQLCKLFRGRKVTFLYSIIRLGTRHLIRKLLLGLALSGLVISLPGCLSLLITNKKPPLSG
jgi:hypothetical protein